MKNNKRKKTGKEALMLLPLYVFTIVFVLGPLVYMVILSFLQRAETWGVTSEITLKNYRNILEPVYLQTFAESFKLAVISTALIVLIGYPFGYFMAKLTAKWKKRTMMLLMIPFWTSSLIRLYGWIIIFRANGVLDKILMALGITEEPLKVLYTYPAVVVGMIYALLPFMIFAVYSSAEKMDWSLVEAARDLGASRMRAFLTVTLKMTLPGLLSGIILTFVPSMGLFFIADSGPVDESPQLAVCRGTGRGADGHYQRDDRAVPEDLRCEGSGRHRVSHALRGQHR